MALLITEEHTFTGRWSRVGGEVGDVPGQLTYTPEEGAHLTLDGAFDEEPTFLSAVSRQHQTIQGVTNTGKSITLFNSLLIRQTWSSGYPVSEYSGPIIAVGQRFESYDALRCRTVVAAFHNLEEILGLTGIDERISVTNTPEPQITLEFRQPKALNVELGLFSVRTAFSCELDGNRFERRGFSQRAHFVISTPEAVHIDQFLSGPIRSLHNLIELAADAVLPLTVLEARSGALADSDSRIDILLQPPRYRVGASRKHPAQLLFTLSGLGDRLEACIQRWHAGRERYGPTFDLFFSLGRSEMFMEHQFLSLVQAIESYHRRAYLNVALPAAEHETRVRRVLGAVDGIVLAMSDDELKWLREKLQYNEPSLASRLRALYDTLPASAKGVLPERPQFVRETAQTRHHMTHWTQDRRSGTLHGGTQLLRGVQQLRLMLKCVFLAELGLVDETIVKRIPEVSLLQVLRESPEG